LSRKSQNPTGAQVSESLTIGELFDHEKITKDHLSLIKEESGYWMRAGDFILQKWDTRVSAMTHAQTRWADDILESMTEMRIERKGIFAE
jgi:hypothetical protein